MHFSPLPAELHPLPPRLFSPPLSQPAKQWIRGSAGYLQTASTAHMIIFLTVYYFIRVLQCAVFFKMTFFHQLSPYPTRPNIITVINNCQSAASVQHMGCLISIAQHLFCGKTDYFLQQARPITLVKWYHINQNLTRWQIWSYQIQRDTVTNMSLSQELSLQVCLCHIKYVILQDLWGNDHIRESRSTSGMKI